MSRYRNERQFGLLLAGVMLVLAVWPLLHRHAPTWLWLLPAAILGLLAWLAPAILAPFAQGWLWFGHQLGRINSFILLTLVFFLIITPLALIFRTARRDPLELRPPNRKSFWHRHEHKPSPDSFRNQF